MSIPGVLYWAIRRLYNRTLRAHLPYRVSVHNGVPVATHTRLFDARDTFPNYESALISAIRGQVHEADSVVVVGGGLGVSTVAAVEATGRRGTVTTFEASASGHEAVSETVRLNRVEERVSIEHSVVGSHHNESQETYGVSGDARVVPPSDLPDCEVLVLDCEGAEVEIIMSMSVRPRVIIVETHGFLDAPEEAVSDHLERSGYEEIDRQEVDTTRGVTVISAINRDE